LANSDDLSYKAEVTSKDENYDLIVVGAGPSGLFCAINCGRSDKRILVLEKNESPGRKLLVSGSGRCNITHEGDTKPFLDHYGDHGRFLRPAIMGFTNRDLISFFESRGLAMKLSDSGKIFPETMRSRDVLEVLVRECRSRGVCLRCGQEVLSISRQGDGFKVASFDRAYTSRLLAIATGGRSYPATGSTGDGYSFASFLGHRISEVGPALTPVYVEDYPFSCLSGVSFPEMEISLHSIGKARVHRGDVLFTHQGLSGPGILDLSRHIKVGDTLRLSFVQGKRRDEVEDWIMEMCRMDGTRGVKSLLAELSIPSRAAERILEISGIPPGQRCAHLTRAMRSVLAENLSGIPLTVSGLGGFDTAMVTRGGVALGDVNSKTMESRIVDGLYFAGEVLDVDGDTGGYNLQAAFSTGMTAARSIRARWI
jgi:hypothetical protein